MLLLLRLWRRACVRLNGSRISLASFATELPVAYHRHVQCRVARPHNHTHTHKHTHIHTHTYTCSQRETAHNRILSMYDVWYDHVFTATMPLLKALSCDGDDQYLCTQMCSPDSNRVAHHVSCVAHPVYYHVCCV